MLPTPFEALSKRAMVVVLTEERFQPIVEAPMM